MSEHDLPLQILIVEDNEDNLAVLQRRLERRGFRTEAARDGREAVSKTLWLRPELVLMDLEMPVMSGFEALQAIRACAALSSIRVAALTAHATREIRHQCDAAGFDDFITKPIDFQALLRLIDRAGVVATGGASAASAAGGA